jgi:hypothetical protein
MKKLGILPGILALAFSLSTAAFAQEMKPLLAMDNQLAQAQAMLAKTLDSAGANSTQAVSHVTFDGCRMSYQVADSNALGQLNTAAQTTSFGGLATLAFDLKAMNIAGVTLTPLTANSNMLLLTLPAIKGQQNVLIERHSSPFNFSSAAGGFLLAAAAMPVRAELAEQLKAQLLKTSVLCQLQK